MSSIQLLSARGQFPFIAWIDSHYKAAAARCGGDRDQTQFPTTANDGACLHYSRFIDRLGHRGRRSIADSGLALHRSRMRSRTGGRRSGRVTSHSRNGAHTTTDTRAAEGNAARMKDCGQSRRRTTNRAQVCGIMNSPDCPLIPFRARALRESGGGVGQTNEPSDQTRRPLPPPPMGSIHK